MRSTSSTSSKRKATDEPDDASAETSKDRAKKVKKVPLLEIPFDDPGTVTALAISHWKGEVPCSNVPTAQTQFVLSLYTVKELKTAGFTAGELHDVNFPAYELTSVGFTAKELKEGGYNTCEELKAAGKAKPTATACRRCCCCVVVVVSLSLKKGGIVIVKKEK